MKNTLNLGRTKKGLKKDFSVIYGSLACPGGFIQSSDAFCIREGSEEIKQ